MAQRTICTRFGPMGTHRVAVVAFDRISPFHLSVPSLVFGEDREADGIPRYDLRVCSSEPRKWIATSGGFTIGTEHNLHDLLGADTVIVPSWRSPEESPPAPLLDALRMAHRDGARTVGLCLGAFVIAAAGLLDGRRATTHWRYAPYLARQYPAVEVDSDCLWIDHDDVITSAGTAAALDCCVHLVRRDHGAEVANRLARRLVITTHRSGDQSQYFERPVQAEDSANNTVLTLEWARRDLSEIITVEGMAAQAHLSRRTFTRHFRAMTGTSPHQWLLGERLALAQSLLETTELSIELVATRSGLGSAVNLRQHFRQRFNTTPVAYRRAFSILDT